jgi:hypothetical protein
VGSNAGAEGRSLDPGLPLPIFLASSRELRRDPKLLWDVNAYIKKEEDAEGVPL